MHFKRFVGATRQIAIQKLKDELGDDAVILSTRTCAEGVEIHAAIDPEAVSFNQQTPSSVGVANSQINKMAASPEELQEAMQQVKSQISPVYQHHLDSNKDQQIEDLAAELKQMRGLLESQLSGIAWGQSELANPHKIEVLRKLLDLGIGWELGQDLVKDVTTELDHAWSFVLKDLESRIPIDDKDILEKGGVIALVGPTGVGKTTTIAKISSRFVMRYGVNELALITTDCYKIGAQEQLRNFAQVIGVPVYIANTQAELQALLSSLSSKRLVLIDTAGTSQRDLQLSQQFTCNQKSPIKVKNYLVLSAGSQLNVMRDIVHRFSEIDLTGCILTKLDEAVQLGNLISLLAESRLPMAYITDGQRVPEDLQRFSPSELIDEALVLGGKNSSDELSQLYRIGMGKEASSAQ